MPLWSPRICVRTVLTAAFLFLAPSPLAYARPGPDEWLSDKKDKDLRKLEKELKSSRERPDEWHSGMHESILLEAVRAGDHARAAMLLAYNHSPQVGYEWFEEEISPLHQAIRQGDVAMVELLVEHFGTRLGELEKRRPAQLTAAAAGQVDCLRVLLEAGWSPNTAAGGSDGTDYPFKTAVERGDLAMASLLIRAGAHAHRSVVDAAPEPLRGQLQAEVAAAAQLPVVRYRDAIARDEIDLLRSLLASEALPPLWLRESKGHTAANQAIQEAVVGIANLPRTIETAQRMRVALERDDLAEVQRLMTGTDPDAPLDRTPYKHLQHYGGTLLLAAAWYNAPTVTDWLIGEGVDLEATDSRGETALIIASARRFLPVVERLLAAGADPGAKAHDGSDALSQAMRHGDSPTTERLLGVASAGGSAGLITAAIDSGAVDQIDALLADGASVNSLDAKGRSPLHAAIRKGDLALVERLLALGARPDNAGFQVITPLGMAVLVDEYEIAARLHAAGAKPGDLIQQINIGNIDGMVWMLERGAPVVGLAARQGTGIDPSGHAERKHCLPCLAVLEAYGAKPTWAWFMAEELRGTGAPDLSEVRYAYPAFLAENGDLSSSDPMTRAWGWLSASNDVEAQIAAWRGEIEFLRTATQIETSYGQESSMQTKSEISSITGAVTVMRLEVTRGVTRSYEVKVPNAGARIKELQEKLAEVGKERARLDGIRAEYLPR